MENYFRNIATTSHTKGFVAGVVTSTVVFGILSSALLYVASRPCDMDEYEFDHRVYSSCDDSDDEFRQNEVEAENIILKVHESEKETGPGNVTVSSRNSPTANRMMDVDYFP
jgi:hypothetical protein